MTHTRSNSADRKGHKRSGAAYKHSRRYFMKHRGWQLRKSEGAFDSPIPADDR